jgi:hypothetical protein
MFNNVNILFNFLTKLHNVQGAPSCSQRMKHRARADGGGPEDSRGRGVFFLPVL